MSPLQGHILQRPTDDEHVRVTDYSTLSEGTTAARMYNEIHRHIHLITPRLRGSKVRYFRHLQIYIKNTSGFLPGGHSAEFLDSLTTNSSSPAS